MMRPMTQRGLRVVASAALLFGAAVAFWAGGHRATDCHLYAPGQPRGDAYWVIAVGVGAGVAAATIVGLRTRPWLRLLIALALGFLAGWLSLVWDVLSWVGSCD
jgi:hypothetical protein